MNTIIAHLQKYYGVYLVIMAALFMILWFQNRAVNRYAIAGQSEGAVYVLDTQTGQLWMRQGPISLDLGTNDKPKLENVYKPQAEKMATDTLKLPAGYELEKESSSKD
jgi:hypothetical protein